MQEYQQKHLLKTKKQILKIRRSRGASTELLELHDEKYLQEVAQEKFQTRKQAVLDHLLECGQWKKISVFCGNCSGELTNVTVPANKTTIKWACGLRYCNHPHCATKRYATNLKQLEAYPRFANLHKLMHVTIGFQRISKEEYEQKSKRYFYVAKTYLKRLKKSIRIEGGYVADITASKDPTDSNYLFLHFHCFLLPWKTKNLKKNLLLLQYVRKHMVSKQRIKTPFHVQYWGLKPIAAVLAYISLRKSGIYKKEKEKKVIKLEEYEIGLDEPLDEDIEIGKKEKLIDKIKGDKHLFLVQIFNLDEYVTLFHRKRFFFKLSNLGVNPYGTIHRNSPILQIPEKCPLCQVNLTRLDVIVKFEDCEPPDHTRLSENERNIYCEVGETPQE